MGARRRPWLGKHGISDHKFCAATSVGSASAGISRGRLLPVTASTSASATASLSRPFSATAHFPLITFRTKAAAGGPRVGIDVQTDLQQSRASAFEPMRRSFEIVRQTSGAIQHEIGAFG